MLDNEETEKKSIGIFDIEDINEEEFVFTIVEQQDWNFSPIEVENDGGIRVNLLSSNVVEKRQGVRTLDLFIEGNEDMREQSGYSFTINKKFKDLLIEAVHQGNGKFKYELEEIKEEKLDEQEKIDFNIKYTPTDEQINEMISKVDIQTFKKIICERLYDTQGYTPQKISANITDERCKEYLKRWAENKYHWYKLFGDNLKLEVEIEVKKDIISVKQKMQEIKEMFPLYYQIFECLDYKDVMNNQLNYIQDWWKKDKRVKRGMKFTQLIALYNNEELNMEVSKIYQEKGKKKICISIEPADYLTVSINKSGWRSCHNFFNGDWSQAPLGYMFDCSSAVSYMYDKIVDFDEGKYKYKINSKQWRQMIYWNGRTSAIVFSRQYPFDSDEISQKIRELMEDAMSKVYNAPNKWRLFSHENNANVSVEKGNYIYNDVKNGFAHKVVRNKFDKSFEREIIWIGAERYYGIMSNYEVGEDSGNDIW